jgi:hypothetical protein
MRGRARPRDGRWHNQLRGLGTGLASLLAEGAPEATPPTPVFEAQRRREASQHGGAGAG